ISEDTEEKTWRPHPLVLSGSPTRRWHLIEFASSITQERGILTIATVLTSQNVRAEKKSGMEGDIREYMAKRGVQGLVRVISAPDSFEGAKRMVDYYGLGALVPNTIILGDSENLELREKYCDMIRYFYQLKRNVVIIHDNKEKHFGERKTIDVWWGGLKGNGGLMILLTYLLQSSVRWHDADVTIKMVVKDEKAIPGIGDNLSDIMRNIRIEAKTELIVSKGRDCRSGRFSCSRTNFRMIKRALPHSPPFAAQLFTCSVLPCFTNMPEYQSRKILDYAP
ncbi:MAG: hypothetical protein LC662_05775, partial [Rhodothermaceae bacterium]|nr:hypothetical protein [Rhodothermaceae bacterium]